MDLTKKRKMITANAEVSIMTQCEILGLSRSGLYYEPRPLFSATDLEILNRMDKIYTESPHYGYRKHYAQLMREKFKIGIQRVRSYMKVLGLSVIYPKKKTTIKNKIKQPLFCKFHFQSFDFLLYFR